MDSEKPTQEDYNNWSKDPNNWKYGGLLYYNKNDDRILVPKKTEWMGITFNFANPKSIVAFLAFLAFFGLVIFTISYKK